MLKTEPRVLAYAITLLCAPTLACGGTPVEGSATGSEGSSGTDSSTSAVSNSGQPTTSQGSDSATDSTVSGNSNSATDSTTAGVTTDGLTSTGPGTDTQSTGVVDTSDTGTSTSTGTTAADTGTTAADTGTTAADTGTTAADTGTTGTTGDPVECGLQLKATIRDFKQAHPDFESYCCSLVTGLVKPDLGADKKPVFNQIGNPQMLTDAPTFNQWYNNTNGVNMPTQIVLDLQEIQPGVFSYQNNAFFPIDNQLFGNEGNPHNYHFTTEIHTSFQYTGGETFTFTGDDDVWVYINKKLVIDLGGVHGNTPANVKLDDLGLTPGVVYPLDVFHAERHLVGSNFRIDTTICSQPQ